MQVTLSNRVEQLYELLKQQLFGTGMTCFARRLVIVPSPAMKAWLMLRLAQDPEVGIAAGMEVVFLEPGIGLLTALFHEKKEHVPSVLEMALKIESEIRAVVRSPAAPPVWQPLFHYLKVLAGKPLTRRSERRLVKLSEMLARLFREYGRYGGEMLTKWESEPIAHWQQALWCALFSERWTYPYREFAKPLNSPPMRETQVFLFAISFLSTSQHQFFKKISNIIPVHLYLLSPCLAYWGDIRSDRENKALQRFWKKKGISKEQEQALEEFLRDRNPLLANFGKLGRHMAEQIEEFDERTTESYSLPHACLTHPLYEEMIDYEQLYHDEDQPLTLLRMVQADIALLRNPSMKEKILLDMRDQTIQIHVSSSRLREVQNLYDTLMALIEKNREEDQPIAPSDIVVMAPNIVAYEPYIRAVFEAENSVLGCQIMDLTVPLQSRLVQGFLHLLTLPSTRWEASALLHLFEHPAFQRKQGLTREEVRWIGEWTREAGIRWGKNAGHRSEILGEERTALVGTWEHGFHLIIRSLVSTPMEERGMLSAIHVEASQSPALGKFILLIRSLYADLTSLNNGSLLTLDEWSTYLECLLESYFAIDYKEESEETEQLLLRRHIQALKHAHRQLGDEKFPFESIKLHLTASLEQEQVSYREHHLQAVRFCSMLPMRAIPAKVVALMGMEEGAFPKCSQVVSLDYLRKEEPVDFCPLQTDYDRYLFLEMLLSARDTFILSYCQAEDQPPSTLVAELVHYLDRACLVGEGSFSSCRIYEHPFLAYDHRYFEGDSSFKSYSEERYRAAVAYYRPDKTPSHQFLDPLLEKFIDEKEESILNLRQIAAFARNPLKVYFNQSLNIYIREEDESQDDENIVVSHKDAAVMAREGLKRSLPSIFRDAENRGLLPSGVFKDIAQEKISEDHSTIVKTLKEVGIAPDGLFEIVFSSSQETIERQSPTRFCVPALCVEHANKRIQIVGTLPLVSAEGLVAFVEDKETDIFKIFPEFIILCCAIEAYGLPISPRLIPMKKNTKGVVKHLHDCPRELLSKFLSFFFDAVHHPCPLQPEWMAELLKGSDTSFAKVVEDAFDNHQKPIYNPYICWIAPTGDDLDAAQLHERWKRPIDLAYGETERAWFPKKEKGVANEKF